MPVERPKAPSLIPWSTSCLICSSSPAEGSLASYPMTEALTVPCPMRVPTFTGMPPLSRRSRYSATLLQSQGMPSSSSLPPSKLFPSSVMGTTELPQLPTISVVTPCRILLSALGLMMKERSVWVWTSTKPGVISLPLASISTPASCSPRLPTAAILSPMTATSPLNQGFPEPSTILPFLKTMSKLSITHPTSIKFVV